MAGLFDRWFRRSAPIARRVEDRVWADAPACARGVRAQVARALQTGDAVLLLARSMTDREDLARDLATHAPRIGGDRFVASDLQSHLRSRAAFGLALVSDLRPTARATGATTALQVHVLARGARGDEDRTLLALLAPWSPARVVFHHSLDDALLRSHAVALQPLLQKLGLDPDEPIASPLLTRAIERAQRP